MHFLLRVFLIGFLFSSAQSQRQGCLPDCNCGPQATKKGMQYRILSCNSLPRQPLPIHFTTLQAKRSGSNISRSTFEIMKPVFITTLDLCNSGIEHIADATFAAVPHMTTLKLSLNSIHTLTVGYFLGCNRLQKIYLDGNDLRTIEEGCFRRLPNLKVLHLHHNKLKILPTLPPSVYQLDISNNIIPTLDKYSFKENMKQLDLCNNPIQTIPQACFAQAKAITSLCAPNIPIVLKSSNTSADSGTILPSMQNFTLIAPTYGIELSDNIILQISAMENLLFLTIVGFKISAPMFLGKHQLRKLSLEHVRLMGNKEKEFLNAVQKQLALEELILDNSPQLAQILLQDALVWSKLINLHHLGLHNCSLTTLANLQNEKGMTMVTLSNNPLHCDCHLANKFNNGMMLTQSLTTTLCRTPPKYQGQELAKIIPELCDESGSEEGDNDYEKLGEFETTRQNQNTTKNNSIVLPGIATNGRDVIPDSGLPVNKVLDPPEDDSNSPGNNPSTDDTGNNPNKPNDDENSSNTGEGNGNNPLDNNGNAPENNPNFSDDNGNVPDDNPNPSNDNGNVPENNPNLTNDYENDPGNNPLSPDLNNENTNAEDDINNPQFPNSDDNVVPKEGDQDLPETHNNPGTGDTEFPDNIDNPNNPDFGRNPDNDNTETNPNGSFDEENVENPPHDPVYSEEITTDHEKTSEVSTKEYKTEAVTQGIHHAATSGHTSHIYMDKDEYNTVHSSEQSDDKEKTYIIVGIVMALTVAAAVIFTTLFFYFRRRGHAGIEGTAQYKSQTTSRDNLVKNTARYD